VSFANSRDAALACFANWVICSVKVTSPKYARTGNWKGESKDEATQPNAGWRRRLPVLSG